MRHFAHCQLFLRYPTSRAWQLLQLSTSMCCNVLTKDVEAVQFRRLEYDNRRNGFKACDICLRRESYSIYSFPSIQIATPKATSPAPERWAQPIKDGPEVEEERFMMMMTNEQMNTAHHTASTARSNRTYRSIRLLEPGCLCCCCCCGGALPKGLLP
jgi:hypothetical protein